MILGLWVMATLGCPLPAAPGALFVVDGADDTDIKGSRDGGPEVVVDDVVAFDAPSSKWDVPAGSDLATHSDLASEEDQSSDGPAISELTPPADLTNPEDRPPDVPEVSDRAPSTDLDVDEDRPLDAPEIPDVPVASDLSPPSDLAAADRPPPLYSARSVFVGGASSCVVTPLGSVLCWGQNGLNKLNLGLNEYGRDQLLPRLVPGLTDVASMHLGDAFACALLVSGRVRCWGANSYGQRGAGRATEITSSPDVAANDVLDVTTASALTGGEQHACVLEGANVRCWGNNDRMQCGSGSDPIIVAPRTVAGLPRVAAVRSGAFHVCAVGMEGEVYCWGENRNGQLGMPSPPSSATPLRVPLPERALEVVAGENFSCALGASRGVYCWGPASQIGVGETGGATQPPTRVPGVSMVSSLAAGHQLAVVSVPSGVLAWGWHARRELGLPEGTPPLLTYPTRVPLEADERVAIAYGYVCALAPGGAVRCAGSNDRGQLGGGDSTGYAVAPVASAAASARLDFAPSSSQMCVLDSADAVTCYVMDSTDRPRTERVTPPGRTRAVAAGQDFVCALSEAGTVSCWGNNIDGQLGNGSSSNSATPVDVSGLTGVVRLSADLHNACAVAPDGVYCWGANYQGNVDPRRTEGVVRSPVRVLSSAAIEGVSVGPYHSCAWSGASVTCWGQNSWGQIAFAPRGTRVGPSPWTASAPVRAVSVGDYHTCAILMDGTSTCWGANSEGEVGVLRRSNSELPSAVLATGSADELCAGSEFSCARRAGGVSCWGRGTSGQLGDGDGRSSLAAVSVVGLGAATAIRCGPNLACARLTDSTLRCWGSNNFRLFGPGYVAYYRTVSGF